jgi:UMF2 family putative MFS family transporter
LDRRLLALISALLLLEVLFMAVLSPLLPELKREFRLSTVQTGALQAMYALGAVAGALTAMGLVDRRGARYTALLSLLVFAATSAAFGLADGYPGLLAARVGQGFAGAVCWAAGMVWLLEVGPAGRRGELLGVGFGVAQAGAIAGPAVGGLAAVTGRAAVFVGVAALCLLLVSATTRFRAPPPVSSGGGQLVLIASSASVRRMVAMSTLPSVLLAAIGVLGPLQQHSLGAGPLEIAATFAIAALASILIRPLFGRWSDRDGPLRPLRVGLIVNLPIALVLPWLEHRFAVAATICLALVLAGTLWAPLMVMLSDACAAAGASQLLAVVAMNLTWPPGGILGAAGGAAVAQALGMSWSYLIMGAAMVATLLALATERGGPEGHPTPADRVPSPVRGPRG